MESMLVHVLEPCYICLTLDQTLLSCGEVCQVYKMSRGSSHESFVTLAEILERQHVFGIEVLF